LSIAEQQSPVNPSYQTSQTLVVDARIKRMIAGAFAEIDLAQIVILRTLTPAERFQQLTSMIAFAERVAVYRLRGREPQLSEQEAFYRVRCGSLRKLKQET